MALGGTAYELVAHRGGGRRDGSVRIDFNWTINLPFAFAFTAYGTCPAPVPGNRLGLPVTAGEKKLR